MAHDDLRLYRAKRNFDRTAEPLGTPGKKSKRGGRANAFVIHRHHASHLHFDLRLEMDGVLKSWAVPKGPSMDPADKRLAVQVEDHPLSYAPFEGAIPEGEYGAGYVLIWDEGIWIPHGDPTQGLAAGNLKFTLQGKRLAGDFALIRMHAKAGASKHNWLLIKEREDLISPGKRPAAFDARVPALSEIKPQLATLQTTLPPGRLWAFEIKLDGYRAMASIEASDEGKNVRILSRNHQDWSTKFASVVSALKELNVNSAVFDGEICAVDPEGRTSFQALQHALSNRSESDERSLTYFIFDLLFLDGIDLRNRPLSVRKEILQKILNDARAPLAYVTHTEDAKEARQIFKKCCELGLEGLVAKRMDRPYAAGRSPTWLKIKCVNEQEAVILGFTPPRGSRVGFGALLLGVFDHGKLRYAGKVGTGFSDSMLRLLAADLRKLRSAKAPASGVPRLAGVTWVKPQRVCVVRFSEWTTSGVLRHPSFIGLREDKDVNDVVAEHHTTSIDPGEDAKVMARKGAKKPHSVPRQTEGREIGGFVITHPDRVVDPRSGLTKADVATYLEAVGALLLPYAQRRPLSLVRCTHHIDAACFFQKKKSPGMDPSVHAGFAHEHDVLYVTNASALVSLVQFGAIEFHGWGSRFPHVTKADWMVIDLDPDESLPFHHVVTAALEVREIFQSIGLTSFVKTTGGKGLHVVAPFEPKFPWRVVKELAKSIATSLETQAPDRFTSRMAKANRHGKIFVDYLRNGEGATAVLPYSPRAREHLPIAMPVAWSDLAHVNPKEFTLATVAPYLKRRKKDPWSQFFTVEQALPASLSRLLKRA